ncbi:hypothetical protein SAMN05444671_4158 [Flavobacterium sp. CF108]|uniref:hypothetical protein n=1 Tax=unclassified Flavobacterium TaxID=196869 RepID=UPI0008AAF7A7|nr:MULTISPECIES: hypothetical protein [unclassified Flavobacterium]SEO68263.1 hypothetical protein SAMN04487978_3412 [Flavobacterium sp. fv08]SHH89801.1 hypothetical protein SAMN05444671_4158 [Flavobacterium sp. CF108]
MREIRIKNSIKLFEVDKLYDQLNEMPNEVIDLRLPRYIEKYFFSLAPSIIQFVATWIRSDKKGKLIIDLNLDDFENTEKYYEQEFFFPIISLAWNEITISNLSGDNLRPFLRPFQNKFIVKMRKAEAMKGEKLLLINLDHFDSQSGILNFFEENGSFNINEKELETILKKPILEKVIKYQRSKIEIERKFNHIIGIIFELMKNTFEWGKEDELGVPWNPNIRGLYIRSYKRPQLSILNDNFSDDIITDYFSHPSLETNNSQQLFFVEISVFDTGSGFIKKFHNKNNVTDDFSILKSCLIKHQTSSIGNLENDKGIGLDRILNLLDDHGFIRIKTDKYCVYRNMIKDRYRLAENYNPDKMQIFDWETGSENILSSKYQCSGSIVSILYPISFTNKQEHE